MQGLDDVLRDVLQGWEPPRVVAIGSENAGKSTMLERLCMLSLFPHDYRLCTRMPIRVSIRRGPSRQPPTIEVWDLLQNCRVGEPEVIPLVRGDVDIKEAMLRAIEDEGIAGDRRVSEAREIRVHIVSPSLPPMNLIDLPGIVSNPKEDAAKTRRLVARHMANSGDQCLYLAMVPVSEGPRSSEALSLVVAAGLESRTIGVITKCDKMDDFREVTDALDNSQVPLVPHGYVATMNKKLASRQGETNAGTLQRQAVQETQWFEDQGFHEQVAGGLASTRALLDRVNAGYVTYVRSHWLPQTVGHLVQALSRCEEEEAALGLPAADRPVRRGGAPAEPDLGALRAAAVACVVPILQGVYRSEARLFYSETLHRLRQPLMDAIEILDARGNNLAYNSEPVTMPVDAVSGFLAGLRRPDAGTVLRACRTACAELPRRWSAALGLALADDGPPFRLQRFPGLVARLKEHFVADAPGMSADAFEEVRAYLAGAAFAPGSSFVELVHEMRADPPVVRVTFNPRAVVETIVHLLVRGQTGMAHARGVEGHAAAVVAETFGHPPARQEQELCHVERQHMRERQRRIDAAVRRLIQLRATMPGPEGLREGAKVSLKGLPERHLNGQHGAICGAMDGNGFWPVVVDSTGERRVLSRNNLALRLGDDDVAGDTTPLRQLIREQLDDIPAAAMQLAVHRTSVSADEFVACDDQAYVVITTRDSRNEQLKLGGLRFKVAVRPVGDGCGDAAVPDMPVGLAEYVGEGVYRHGFTITQEHARACQEHAQRQLAARAEPKGGGAAAAQSAATDTTQEIMYEATVTYHGVPLDEKPRRFSVRLSRTYDCRFPGRPFAAGVLHKIGTLGDSKRWVNPCDAKLVAIQRTPATGRRGKSRDIAAPEYSPGLLGSKDCCTGEADRAGQEMPTVTVDLGVGRMVMPTHYCLRGGSLAPFATEVVLDGIGGVDGAAFNGTYQVQPFCNGAPSYVRSSGTKVLWYYDDYWVVTERSDCQAWDRVPSSKKWQVGVLYSEQRKCLSPGAVGSWRMAAPKGAVGTPVAVHPHQQRLTVTRHEDVFETRTNSEGKARQVKTCTRYHHSGGGHVTNKNDFKPILSTKNARARVTQTAPMSWRLESSADSFSWVTLSEHRDVTELTRGSYATAHFAITRQITGTTKGHRHFRIVQTRLPEQWPNRLFIAGFELYGTLSDLTKVADYKRDQCVIS